MPEETRCNSVHVPTPGTVGTPAEVGKGQCILKYGHDGPHEYQGSATAAAAAASDPPPSLPIP